jgi:hypothetical protein
MMLATSMEKEITRAIDRQGKQERVREESNQPEIYNY